MEAVKKAASGAVERVRNSPLFRRKFGTARSDSPLNDGESGGSNIQQELHPERDLTPFVQGVYFNVSSHIHTSDQRSWLNIIAIFVVRTGRLPRQAAGGELARTGARLYGRACAITVEPRPQQRRIACG